MAIVSDARLTQVFTAHPESRYGIRLMLINEAKVFQGAVGALVTTRRLDSSAASTETGFMRFEVVSSFNGSIPIEV